MIKKLPIWAVIKDIENYISWIKTINKEKADPDSIWNRYGMNHNFFYVIYFPIKLQDEYSTLPDSIKRLRIVEYLAPIHRYLDEDLGFAEYIVPEFNQFYEDDNPTLIYGIVYRFAFKKLSLKWLLYRLFIISTLLWVFIKFPIISTLIQWFKTLI